MDSKRFGELKSSIEQHGLLHEIVLCDGKILDGRNRYKAALEAGIDPRFKTIDGDPFAYAWMANGERRDLVADQRYLIWKRATEKSGEWQKKRDRIKAAANKKRSSTQKGVAKSSSKRDPTTSGATSHSKAGSKAKAAASNTNRGTVERMDKLDRERPDLAAKVRTGEIKPTAALRQMKKDEVSVKVQKLPRGKHRVLYADPPWKYNDDRIGLGAGDSSGKSVDRASTAARNHYPTMSKTELCELGVKDLAAKDAVLFCSATFPLLPVALNVVKAWGFEYKTAFVWDKGRGSFGNYHKANAELLLVCTRGSCTPDIDEKEPQVIRCARGRHSEKPERFREMIDKLYPHGPRIELFRRGERPKGWKVWGPETK